MYTDEESQQGAVLLYLSDCPGDQHSFGIYLKRQNQGVASQP